MLFTENRYDRSMEQMMKGIPNFYPRGSGIVVTGKLDYDFHVRKVIGTQNEYDNCDEDIIDGVISTADNLKGWYFRVNVSSNSQFYQSSVPAKYPQYVHF